MKKMYLTLGLAIVALGVNAQNEQIQNSKGINLMPEKGDFAIGINALPVLLYVGDLFGSGQPNTALGGNKFVSVFASNTLFGKYMLTDNTAIRAHFRVGVFGNTYNNNLDDDGQVDPFYQVTDTYTSSSSIYNLGVGYEWRRGKTRLRGIYGGEVFYQHRQGANRQYVYGNPLQDGNSSPTSTIWDPNGGVIFEGGTSSRIISNKLGNFNGVGLRAFAGIEYFFAPKICVGTEFGWGGMYGTTGNSTVVTEFWNGVDDIKQERTSAEPGSSSFRIDTDNFNGALYLMFYF